MTGDIVTWSEGLRKQEAGLVDNIKLDTYINLVPKYPIDVIVQKDSSRTEDRTRRSSGVILANKERQKGILSAVCVYREVKGQITQARRKKNKNRIVDFTPSKRIWRYWRNFFKFGKAILR